MNTAAGCIGTLQWRRGWAFGGWAFEKRAAEITRLRAAELHLRRIEDQRR